MARTTPLVGIAAALLVALAGCAPADADSASDASASPEPSATATPEPSAEPTPSAEPSAIVDPTAGWDRQDLGWVSIPLPAGWSVDQWSDSHWMVVDDRGLNMVSLDYVASGGQTELRSDCSPLDAYPHELLDVVPYAGGDTDSADAWASAGTEMRVATTLMEAPLYGGGSWWGLNMGITTQEILDGPCAWWFAADLADGASTLTYVVPDPAEGLSFDTRDAALAYLDSAEHQTLTDLLLGIRFR